MVVEGSGGAVTSVIKLGWDCVEVIVMIDADDTVEDVVVGVVEVVEVVEGVGAELVVTGATDVDVVCGAAEAEVEVEVVG